MDAPAIIARSTDFVPVPGEPTRLPFPIDSLLAESARIQDQSEAVNILSCSSCEEDHRFLDQAFANSSKWPKVFQPVLHKCPDLTSAVNLLRRLQVAIVLCDEHLPGTWQHLLTSIQALPNTPFLIVTSRLADDELWAEALNIGAYDVLAKPFEMDQLTRVITSAWRHWTYQQELLLQSVKAVMQA